MRHVVRGGPWLRGAEGILHHRKNHGLAAGAFAFPVAGIGVVGVSPMSSATFDSMASAQTR